MNIHFYNWILLTGIATTILIILLIIFPPSIYLIALIIIFGALLVFFVGESYFKDHIDEKREKFLLEINPIIGSNIQLARQNIQVIKNKSPGEKLIPLKNIWESKDSNLTKIGLDEQIRKDLSILKESLEEINKNISEFNALKVKFNDIEDSDKFTSLIARIVSFEDNLEVKLGEFIKNSQKLSFKIEEIISSNET